MALTAEQLRASQLVKDFNDRRGPQCWPTLSRDTLGAVIKDRDDLEVVCDNLEEITSGA